MPRTKKFRRLRLLVVLLALLLVAGAAVGGWLGVRTVRASFPQTTGSIHLAGLSGPVQVERDANGIPQIYADTSADLFMAQGYVQAQDRFWQMDVNRHVTSGTLASMFGKSQVQTDTFIRTMNWRGVAQTEYDTMLNPETKKNLDAYSAGVNAWLGEHPGGAGASLEYALLGAAYGGYKPAPWTPVDSISWLKAMAWDLSGNMQQEIDRSLLSQSLTKQQIAELYPSYPYSTNGTILAKTGTVSNADGKKATYRPADGAGASAQTVASGSNGSSGSNGGSGSTGSNGGNGTSGTPASYRSSTTPGSGSGTAGGSGTVQGLQQVATQLAANLDSVPALLGAPGQGIGSNSWVVAGSHTTTTKPLLANDPHLGPGVPSVWYQMGLHCTTVSAACPYDVTGFTFAGMPGVVIGHNQSISWGFTNLGADVQDLYLEQVTGPDTYLYDNQDQKFTTRTETIKVAGGPDQTVTVRTTADGMPIISDHSTEEQSVGQNAPVDGSAPPRGGGYAIALKWTALEPGKTMDAVFELDRATDFTHFRAAATDFAVPAQNLIYADTAGNIGYQAPGRIPIRPKIAGDDGTYPQPGWDSRYVWQGYIPTAALPWVENPSSGYIVTANQAVVDTSYPYELTDDWGYGTRAKQIASLIQSKLQNGGRISPDDMRTMQLDDTSVMAQTLVPYLLNAKLSGAYYVQAQNLLKDWDFQQDSGSAAAAYYNAVWSNLLHIVFDEKFPASVRATSDCVLTVPPAVANLPADGVNGQPQRVSVCGTRSPDEAMPDGSDQWTTAVTNLLNQPNSDWWSYTNTRNVQVQGRDNVLAAAMIDARMQMTALEGKDISTWSWGRIHTLTLKEQTLGTDDSSIFSGLVHQLLNRGPYQLDGGSAAVDATGWNAAAGYQVDWAPSMRMVVDLSDLDSSRWITIGGASGHAYDAHYDDQTPLWAKGDMLDWVYSRAKVDAAAKDKLTLTPQ
ncbi:penicillin acylase family protein [Streptacidiphilus sp. EB129]|uniref:penicillin acylase family protein n=1 Tax=Streptacidiphilus sp. EB129 TaxID=3156262 RepID=UPI00351147DE